MRSEALKPDGPLVEQCWAEMEPAQGVSTLRDWRTAGTACVLPLRVGARMIGVVVLDCPATPRAEMVVTR